MIAKETTELRIRHNAWVLPAYLCFLLVAIYFENHGAGIWFVAICIVALSCFVFLDLWHNVTYRDGIITGVLFPHRPVSITTSDITSVRREIDMFRLETRMCIAIHDDHHKKVIKVSLSVLVREDIRELMQIIHDARPDLTIPEGWAAKST